MSETKVTPAEFVLEPAIEPNPKAPLAVMQPTRMTPMEMLQVAVSNGASIEVIERLKALYDQERARHEESEFNVAMNRAQAGLERIAPDLNNAQTSSKYASYAAIDKVLRPVYSKEGFSLSFNTAKSDIEQHVKIICLVSHTGGHTRRYEVDMPADGKGAKGGDVMTKTHAAGSAMSYGQRYLAKLVFNIAVGPDDDGNAAECPKLETLSMHLDRIKEATDRSTLTKAFQDAYREGSKAGALDDMKKLVAAKDKRWSELADVGTGAA